MNATVRPAPRPSAKRADATAPADPLGEIVAELAALRSRSHHARYGATPLPELPSKPAVIGAIDGFVAALFPRHFGPKDLTYAKVDTFVADVLARSLAALEREIGLELALTGHAASTAGAGPGEIAGAFAAALPGIRALLETDIRAAYEGDPAAGSIDEVMCCYPGVSAIIRHRLAHQLYRSGVPMLARIISEASHAATGIDIHPGAEIGERFFIDHGTGVVIGQTAVIGVGVRLYQGVTLGARRFEVDRDGALAKHYPRHPVIADNVVIYAGASVLGRITLGAGSVIGGNVWLTESVPAGSMISQTTARRRGGARRPRDPASAE
jgi:serine O-acetyltransferase